MMRYLSLCSGIEAGPRYKAIGNSMAVPVMRWIGQRIARAIAAQENGRNHA